MESPNQFGRRLVWLAVLNLLLFSASAFAGPAARVEFAAGSVTVVTADGHVRPLLKGATVEEGETVNTNEGRAQLRFTDDGFISLHSETVFRIDAYRWSGVTDGTERGFFSLVKGALRTITGRLAKINKKAYQMSSMVATIGVRGTEYTMQANGELKGSVADGEIEVCNAGGCVSVPAGQSYYVADAHTKPVLSNSQTNLAPTQPREDRSAARETASAASTAPGGLVPKTNEPLGISAFTATNSGLANKLDGTTRNLIGTVNASTNGLIGFTRGPAATLVGGTGLQQPVQDVTAGVGSVVSVTASTLGRTTASVLDSTGALTKGANPNVNGVTGALNGVLNGALGAGNSGLVGISKPAR